MDVSKLNDFLATRSFIGSDACVTLEDYAQCKAVKGSIDANKHPHAARWQGHVAFLAERFPTHDWRGNPIPKGTTMGGTPAAASKPSGSPQQKAKKAEAPAAATGGGIDEDAIKAVGDDIRVLKEKLKADGKKGKEINTDPGVAALVEKLTKLKAGGAASPKGSPKQAAKGSPKQAPAAAPAGSNDDAIKAVGDDIRILKEKLKADGKKGKEVNNDPGVAALVAKLTELKKAAPAAAPAEKKEKGGKKEEKKDDEPKAVDPAKKKKAVIKEGGKRGVEIEGAADMGGLQFFCTAVAEPDGDVELTVRSMEAMNEKSDPTEEERKGGSGHIGKMIFSAGPERLAVCAYVPEKHRKELDCKAWIEKVLGMFGGKLDSHAKDVCAGHVATDGNKNIFPLKIREPMILEANNFLRKLGLFPEDDSDDDEMVFGDDDFPS